MVTKVVDTWKKKIWYQINAPQIFEGKVIGSVVSSDGKNLINRIVKISLDELTGNISQTYTVMKLKIYDVKGNTAYTKFVGHEVLPSFIKTFIKRRMTLIDDVIDIKTKDDKNIRIKYIIFTVSKVARGAEAKIRNVVKAEMKKNTQELNLDQLIQEIFFKKLAIKMIPIANAIAPIRRIEINKTELK